MAGYQEGLPLDELDDLLGYIAAEANHTKSRKLENEHDGLYDRLQNLVERGRWVKCFQVIPSQFVPVEKPLALTEWLRSSLLML